MLNFLPRIMGALLLLGLVGCSAVQTGYNNAPTLLYWWLDGYIDFNNEQSRPVRNSLDALHAWHRREELPAYADLLKSVQQQAGGPVSAAQVCVAMDQARVHLRRLGEQAAEVLTRLAPTLQPEQLRQLDREFEKSNRKWRAERLDGTPAELLERSLERAVNRYEDFYGPLSEAQLTLLRQRIAASSYDPRLAWAERLRRQQDILRVLQEHRGSDRPAHIKAEMLALAQRSLEPPDPVMRAGFEQVLRDGCQTIAALNASASEAQRRRLVKRLQSYEGDLRALAAAQ